MGVGVSVAKQRTLFLHARSVCARLSYDGCWVSLARSTIPTTYSSHTICTLATHKLSLVDTLLAHYPHRERAMHTVYRRHLL